MKKWVTTALLVCAGVFLIIVTIFNILSTNQNPILVSNWLSFTATFLGATGSFVLGFVTYQSNKQLREQNKDLEQLNKELHSVQLANTKPRLLLSLADDQAVKSNSLEYYSFDASGPVRMYHEVVTENIEHYGEVESFQIVVKYYSGNIPKSSENVLSQKFLVTNVSNSTIMDLSIRYLCIEPAPYNKLSREDILATRDFISYSLPDFLGYSGVSEISLQPKESFSFIIHFLLDCVSETGINNCLASSLLFGGTRIGVNFLAYTGDSRYFDIKTSSLLTTSFGRYANSFMRVSYSEPQQKKYGQSI